MSWACQRPMVRVCFATRLADRDAGVVARLRAAGAVILGKLNMHEGALGATTDNPFWGGQTTRRRPGIRPAALRGDLPWPWRQVMCLLTLGTDTLGSVRIPAATAACGG